jgi:hypothetical protein
MRYAPRNAPLGLPGSVEVELVVGSTVLLLEVVGAAVLLVVGAALLLVVGAAVLVVGVVVGVAVLLVDEVVGDVVVLPPSHTNAPPVDDAWHESQQLAAEPTHATVLFDDLHLPAFFLIEHFTRPLLSTRQQVTASGLPHVDLAAHSVTAPLHSCGSWPPATRSFATSFTQLT